MRLGNLGRRPMKRFVSFALVAVLALAVPAGAYKVPHPKPPKPPKPHHPKPPKKPHHPKPPKQHHPKPPKQHHPKPPKPPKCEAKTVGYEAEGTLVKAGTNLTPSGHHRFSGTIEVVVKKAKHHGPTGDHTFTIVKVKV